MKPREPSPLWYVLIFIAGLVPASCVAVFGTGLQEQFPGRDLPTVLFMSVLLSGVVGGPAALVTGALAAVLPMRLNAIAYIAASAGIGAASEALWMLVFLAGSPELAWPVWILAGGTAAACAVATLPFRKRRTAHA